MQSKATTVAKYLAELPEDRRAALEAVRRLMRENLDADFEEGMQYGMIGYYVPHRIFPAGYHCDPKQPLPFAALASQKNYMSLYLMSVYGDRKQLEAFQKAWAKTGKKLDMGKSCIRFKKLDDLALDVLGAAIRRITVKSYIANYEAGLAANRQGSSRAAARDNQKSGGDGKPKSKSTARRREK